MSNEIYIKTNDDMFIQEILDFIRPEIGKKVRVVDLSPELTNVKRLEKGCLIIEILKDPSNYLRKASAEAGAI